MLKLAKKTYELKIIVDVYCYLQYKSSTRRMLKTNIVSSFVDFFLQWFFEIIGNKRKGITHKNKEFIDVVAGFVL
jgi:hypothetical protein